MTVSIDRIAPGSELMELVYLLRHGVFVVEQGVPEQMEVDAYDGIAVHVAAIVEGEVIGTLRVVPDGASVRIGRVAVRRDMRGRGVGRRMMEEALGGAAEQGFGMAVLNSEVEAKGFYSSLGFRAEGDVFEDAGLAHVRMSKAL